VPPQPLMHPVLCIRLDLRRSSKLQHALVAWLCVVFWGCHIASMLLAAGRICTPCVSSGGMVQTAAIPAAEWAASTRGEWWVLVPILDKASQTSSQCSGHRHARDTTNGAHEFEVELDTRALKMNVLTKLVCFSLTPCSISHEAYSNNNNNNNNNNR
jgi:hypothetical protein